MLCRSLCPIRSPFIQGTNRSIQIRWQAAGWYDTGSLESWKVPNVGCHLPWGRWPLPIGLWHPSPRVLQRNVQGASQALTQIRRHQSNSRFRSRCWLKLLGPINEEGTWVLMWGIGERMKGVSGDPRETAYLFQRDVCDSHREPTPLTLHGTFVMEEPDD